MSVEQLSQLRNNDCIVAAYNNNFIHECSQHRDFPKLRSSKLHTLSNSDSLLFIKLGRVISVGFQIVNIKPNAIAAEASDWWPTWGRCQPCSELVREQGSMAARGTGTHSLSL